MQVLSRRVDRVAIVDDDEFARESWAFTIEDADLEGVGEEGPLPSIDEFTAHVADTADAVVCDWQLKVSNYAQYNGEQLVASLYQSGIPALLCTRWDKARVDEIRSYRQYIPVLMRPDELNPDSLVDGLSTAIAELDGELQPERRPWRTLVRVVEVYEDEGRAYVEIPAWPLSEIITLRLPDIPVPIRQLMAAGSRCHAKVNIGAERSEDLYFLDWEPE